MRGKNIRLDLTTGLAYFFIHFSIEVLCFFTLGIVFPEFNIEKWVAYFLFDLLAFATQPFIGGLSEKYPRFKTGLLGNILLISGAAFALWQRDTLWLVLIGLTLFTLGNAMMHISGAMATARASEGRLSESALFVGGGSFGVITGRMLAEGNLSFVIAFIPAFVSILLIVLVDKRLHKKYGEGAFDFAANPIKHSITKDRPIYLIALILFLIVIGRGYVGYGLPTGWNRLSLHTVLLFSFMGLGKILGGVLSDIFGPGIVGLVSTSLALPVLLFSDNFMWTSLLGIALFSMTMAITLGGLFSVLRHNPGIAFGITTIGLLIGSLPVFFTSLPSQFVCNMLNVIVSLFSFFGIWYCIKRD